MLKKKCIYFLKEILNPLILSFTSCFASLVFNPFTFFKGNLSLNSSFLSLFLSKSFIPLQVNGRKVALPHSPSPLISLTSAGQYVILSTTFGLEVRWDGNHYAKITVPRY